MHRPVFFFSKKLTKKIKEEIDALVGSSESDNMEYSRVLTYLIHRNNIRFDQSKFRRRHGVKVEFIDE